MKKVITVLAIALLSFNANGQVRIGLKLATTLPTTKSTKITPACSYTAGIISYINIKKGLNLNIGVDYTSYTYSQTYVVTNSTGSDPHKETTFFDTKYLNAPIGLVYEFKESFMQPYIKTGVAPSFWIKSDEKLGQGTKLNIQGYLGAGVKLNLTEKTAVYAETSYNHMLKSQFEKIDLRYSGVAISILLTRQF